MRRTGLSVLLASTLTLPALAACSSQPHTIEDDIPHKNSTATVVDAAAVLDSRCGWKVTITYQAYDGTTATTKLIVNKGAQCSTPPVNVLVTVYKNGRVVPDGYAHSH